LIFYYSYNNKVSLNKLKKKEYLPSIEKSIKKDERKKSIKKGEWRKENKEERKKCMHFSIKKEREKKEKRNSNRTIWIVNRSFFVFFFIHPFLLLYLFSVISKIATLWEIFMCIVSYRISGILDRIAHLWSEHSLIFLFFTFLVF
jgi:hypothetical protein